MKKLLICLSFFLFINQELFAESVNLIKEPVFGIKNVSNLILNDTFVPLAFFEAKQKQIHVTLSDFSIQTLLEDYDDGAGGLSKTQGDGLGGSAQSLFYSYAFSDKWAFFALNTQTEISGKAIKHSGEMVSYYAIRRGDISMLMAGLAYDFVDKSASKKYSFPIYLALQQKTHDIFLRYTNSNNSDVYLLTDDKNYQSLFIGLAFSWKPLPYLHITPYAATTTNTNLNSDTSVHIVNVMQNTSQDIIGSEALIMSGVDLTYTGMKNFVYSVSVDGIWTEINPITKEVVHGLEMQSLSLSVGYIF